MCTESSSHKTLLTQFIQHLEEDELPFYTEAQSKAYVYWHVFTVAAFVASVVSVLAAALIDKEQFETFGRVILIIAPIVSAVITGLMQIFRFREKEALREDGRIEVVDIINNAKSWLVSARSEDDYRKAFHAVRERNYILEKRQHGSDAALRKDEIPKLEPPSLGT